MDLFQQFLNRVGQGYKQADKALGGWLPGGGAASPLTRAVFPPQPFPARSKELEHITGVKTRIVDPSRTPTLVSRIAPIFSDWGSAHYADPVLNQIGIHGYTGGKTNKQLEMHEIGHLNPADKQYYSYGGTLGRAITGISDRLGNPSILEIPGGLALKYLDAPEEDRAERFANRYAESQGYSSPYITSTGTSDYGNMLRKQGDERINKAIDPIGLLPGAQQFLQTTIRDLTSQGLINEYRQNVVNLRQNYIIPGKDINEQGQLTPGYSNASAQLKKLEEQLRKRGYDPVNFIDEVVKKE